MKLAKVIIRNFMSILDAAVDLDDRGLVSIEGKTEDKDGANSNGSGKSTLINAIFWCNYGDPGKKLDSIDDVVNKKVGKECWVRCTWYDETAKVSYHITRYRKHSLFKNSLRVERIEGFSIIDISKGTDAETQKLIIDILGADKGTFEAACFARQENAPDIPGMTDLELKKLLEKVLPLEQLEPLYMTAKANRDACSKLVGSLELDVHLLDGKLKDLDELIVETKDRADNWLAEVALAEAKIKGEIIDLSLRITSEEASLKPQTKIDDAKRNCKAYIDTYDAEGYKAFDRKFASLKEEARKLKSLISNTPDDCPTCKRPMEKDVARDALLEAELKELNLKIEEGQKEETSWAEIHKIVDTFRVKLRKLEDLERSQLVLQGMIDRYKGDISRLQSDLGAKTTNPHEDTLKSLYDRRSTLTSELFLSDTQLDSEKHKLDILEAVADTFSPKGLRYHLLETVTPALNARTNYYLHQLTDGTMKAQWSTVTKLKSGDYKEKFSIHVSGNHFNGYGSLSGGEKRKVRLACFFALQDVIAKQATKSISLWCGDEIDHALDPAGLERLMGLLHEKTSTKSTILVISHNELREWIPNFTTVVKKDGVSKITGYLSD